MTDVSTFRLNLLRATYLLVAIGLGIDIWPALLTRATSWEPMQAVVCCFLAAISLCALLGIRHPLRMLPLILFELTWKTIWLLAVGLPLWFDGRLDDRSAETLFACLLGWVVFPVAIPWRHAWTHYVRAPADRWRNADAPA